MAGVVITAHVSGGGTVADDLSAAIDDEGWELVIVRGPHACAPCRANQNPHNIPCAQCTGNRAGHGDEPDGDADDQFTCQCRVKLRKKDGSDLNDEDVGSIEGL